METNDSDTDENDSDVEDNDSDIEDNDSEIEDNDSDIGTLLTRICGGSVTRRRRNPVRVADPSRRSESPGTYYRELRGNEGRV